MVRGSNKKLTTRRLNCRLFAQREDEPEESESEVKLRHSQAGTTKLGTERDAGQWEWRPWGLPMLPHRPAPKGVPPRFGMEAVLLLARHHKFRLPPGCPLLVSVNVQFDKDDCSICRIPVYPTS